MKEFNVMEHELVPEHYLLSEKGAEEILKKYKIEKDQLPKIRISDPVVKVLEEIHGDIEEGRIIKVLRKSPTSGTCVVYRVVKK